MHKYRIFIFLDFLQILFFSFLRMPPQSIGLSNWSDRIRHARYWRNEVKKSLGEPLNNLQVVSNSDGDFVMALGNLPGDSNSQTLMTAKIPLHSEAQTTTTLELQPLTMLDAQESKSNEPSAEIALFYERLRGQVVNGISGYSLHNTGAILLSSFSKLQIYKVIGGEIDVCEIIFMFLAG